MYTIRKAVPEDAEGITMVNVYTWKTAYQGLIPGKLIDTRIEELEERTEKCRKAIEEHVHYLVAEDSGRIIGFCSYGKCRNDNYKGAGEIYALYVREKYQNTGIGKTLFDAAVGDMASKNYGEMIVNCLKGNPALGFYQHKSGRVVGERQDEILNTKITEDVLYFPIVKKLQMIDRQDYTPGGSIFHRIAVRGLIRSHDTYALIHSKKYREYKFPGGGRKEGETLKDTLIREVKEETGLTVIPDSFQIVGYAKEMRAGEYEDIMEMISYYCTCQVEDKIEEQNLDDYEADYGYSLEYVTLKDAICNNEGITDTTNIPWIDRDTAIMRLLLSGGDQL
jgi:L-amino acid N-acyltransferase YncA/8-oxo-dGTP pyrophosphatase MutT (NUDIX family)